MSNRPLDIIIDDIASAQKTADVDLDSLPIRLRPSHEIAAREAKDSLPDLRAEYQDRLLATATAFIVSGPASSQEQFADLVETNSGAVVISVKQLHAELAAKIFPSIGHTREFTVDHIAMLNDMIWKLRHKLGVVRDPRFPNITSLEGVKSEAELTDYIKRLMGPDMGGLDLNTLYIADALTAVALAKRFVGKTLPVVIINGDAADNEAIKAKFAFSTDVDLNGVAEIDRTFAIQVFKEAKGRKNRANNQAQ